MKKWTKETAWWPEAHWKMGPTTVPLQNNCHIVLVSYHNNKVDCLMATYYPILPHISSHYLAHFLYFYYTLLFSFVLSSHQQRLTFRFRNFSVSKLLPNLRGFRFRKIWFRKKSLRFGFEKIWSRKKVSVSVSEKKKSK